MWKRWRESRARHKKNNEPVVVVAGFDVDYIISTSIPITVVPAYQTNNGISGLNQKKNMLFNQWIFYFVKQTGRPDYIIGSTSSKRTHAKDKTPPRPPNVGRNPVERI